jgi:Fe-Mn family superoxide dismutase
MAFRLPPLPYPENALEPAIAAWAVKRHYEDNHAGYYKKVNELMGNQKVDRSLLEIALSTEPYTPLNNNAAQAWAHDFWWRSMTPTPMPLPPWVNGSIFNEKWVETGAALFGSGWLWLVVTPAGKLDMIALPDALLPQRDSLKPILVMDLWEHAYYCQYGTKRKDFLKNTLKHLNWAEAQRRLSE